MVKGAHLFSSFVNVRCLPLFFASLRPSALAILSNSLYRTFAGLPCSSCNSDWILSSIVMISHLISQYQIGRQHVSITLLVAPPAWGCGAEPPALQAASLSGRPALEMENVGSAAEGACFGRSPGENAALRWHHGFNSNSASGSRVGNRLSENSPVARECLSSPVWISPR